MAADQGRDDAVSDLVERCLVHVLDADGHGLYLRHPHDRETVLVAFDSDRKRSEETMRKIRRIVLGIVGAAIEEVGGDRDRVPGPRRPA